MIELSGRGGDAEFARFLQIAMGSASELKYRLLLAHDLGFMNSTKYKTLVNHIIEVKRTLAVLVQKVRTDS